MTLTSAYWKGKNPFLNITFVKHDMVVTIA